MSKEREAERFVEKMMRMRPLGVLGVAKWLGVKIVTEELDEKKRPIARDGGEIIEECIDKFVALNRIARRRLLKMMDQTIKEG